MCVCVCVYKTICCIMNICIHKHTRIIHTHTHTYTYIYIYIYIYMCICNIYEQRRNQGLKSRGGDIKAPKAPSWKGSGEGCPA